MSFRGLECLLARKYMLLGYHVVLAAVSMLHSNLIGPHSKNSFFQSGNPPKGAFPTNLSLHHHPSVAWIIAQGMHNIMMSHPVTSYSCLFITTKSSLPCPWFWFAVDFSRLHDPRAWCALWVPWPLVATLQPGLLGDQRRYGYLTWWCFQFVWIILIFIPTWRNDPLWLYTIIFWMGWNNRQLVYFLNVDSGSYIHEAFWCVTWTVDGAATLGQVDWAN